MRADLTVSYSDCFFLVPYIYCIRTHQRQCQTVSFGSFGKALSQSTQKIDVVVKVFWNTTAIRRHRAVAMLINTFHVNKTKWCLFTYYSQSRSTPS